MQKQNLAARAGRWSAQHRKKAVFGWLAFVIAAVFIGGQIGTKTIPSDEEGLVGESARSAEIVKDSFPRPLVSRCSSSPRPRARKDPAFKAAVADVEKGLAAQKDVTESSVPLRQGERRPDLA